MVWPWPDRPDRVRRLCHEPILILTRKIDSLGAKLDGDPNFRDNMDLIERDKQQLSRGYHTKKRRILTKLMQSKPSKNKRHCRKKRNTGKEHNVDVDTSMVINVSNVPLSDSELSLLSKGLSFCPKWSHKQIPTEERLTNSRGGSD